MKSNSKFNKSIRRKKIIRKRRLGFARFNLNMKLKASLKGSNYVFKKFLIYKQNFKLPPKPDYSENIKYLLSIPELFSQKTFNNTNKGHIYLPKCFSLVDNYHESFDFLKELFLILQKNETEELILDYVKCERIDVDASICMDVMLAEFKMHINECRRLGYRKYFDKGITPINFEKENILNVLFSIGAQRNLNGISFKSSKFEALPVLINDNRSRYVWNKSEIDLTKIVEYIKLCLNKLNRELTAEAENEFYKVIGEVMSNALEHGTMRRSYAIGFFEEIKDDNEHFGIFNFSIFNFGDTIYQTFKKDTCLNQKAVEQMTELSENYTKKGWFKKASFEEETLWTLYALQEGVTSKDKKRGNGSIQYIENFFKLKGDMNKDNISKMVIVSGNTRIIFDGTYGITPKQRTGEQRKYKMITFNNSGDIHDEPDKKFVSFAPHFFPGTMISARILIKFVNTTEDSHGIQSS
jgi:hypothetical protein